MDSIVLQRKEKSLKRMVGRVDEGLMRVYEGLMRVYEGLMKG